MALKTKVNSDNNGTDLIILCCLLQPLSFAVQSLFTKRCSLFSHSFLLSFRHLSHQLSTGLSCNLQDERYSITEMEVHAHMNGIKHDDHPRFIQR